jgi:hypothetical protein
MTYVLDTLTQTKNIKEKRNQIKLIDLTILFLFLIFELVCAQIYFIWACAYTSLS